MSLVPVPANAHARALTKSLGAGRADAAADPVVFEEADLRAAIRTVLVERLRGASLRQAPETVVLMLDDEAHPEADDLVAVNAADVKAAMGIALAAVVGREVRAALNRITGRVD